MAELVCKPSQYTLSLAAGSLIFSGCSANVNGEINLPSETCQPFTVYAQNRFPAPSGGYGAVVRKSPSIDAEIVGSYAGNDTIRAIGYVIAKEAYPNNPEQIDGDHWLVTDIGESVGYISDAGVRTGETQPDPTGGYSDKLGPVVMFKKLPDNCNLT